MPKLKYAMNGVQFQNEAKKYVINMECNKQRLHKKNGCQWSKCFDKYYDFDSMESVIHSGVEFVKCKLCFMEDC